MVTGRTIVHALIGAVVYVVLSFIPFSTVIGGAAAGFLEGPNDRDGAIVGALVGAITFLPVVAVGIFLVAVMGIGVGTAGVPVGGAAIALLFFAFAFAAVLLYTVGLAALGGYLGAYLAREYPEKRRSTRRTIGIADRPGDDHYPRNRPPEPRARDESRDWRESSERRLEDERITDRNGPTDRDGDSRTGRTGDRTTDRHNERTTDRDGDIQRDRDTDERTESTRWREERESDRES